MCMISALLVQGNGKPSEQECLGSHVVCLAAGPVSTRDAMLQSLVPAERFSLYQGDSSRRRKLRLVIAWMCVECPWLRLSSFGPLDVS